MCLVLLALQSVPGYPLVLAANREEAHARPAAPLHWWPDRPDMAGGRDSTAGGTWLAVRRDGRVATVLNAPGPGSTPGARSRGELVPDFLAADDAVQGLARVHTARQAHAGFHFLAAGEGQAWYTGRQASAVTRLRPGLHAADRDGVATAAPRAAHARAGFPAAARSQDPGALLELLADERIPADAGGDTRPVFLRGRDFGTRCSTVLRIDRNGAIELIERRFGADGTDTGATHLGWNAQSFGTGWQ